MLYIDLLQRCARCPYLKEACTEATGRDKAMADERKENIIDEIDVIQQTEETRLCPA